MEQQPSTVFEALTGVPAPRSYLAEPMNMESAGGVCDFCPTQADNNPPVTWAFPAGQAVNTANISGFDLGFPITAGLWYACERCRRHIKANRWADLARDCGYPEGSAGSGSWPGFRVARKPGPGYAWPLIPHKLPTVHKHVRDAWERGKQPFIGETRERLDRANLLLEIDGHLYVRCGTAGDDRWMAEHLGDAMVAPFRLAYDRIGEITLLRTLQ